MDGHVIVADIDVTVRCIICQLLSDHGHKNETADRGVERRATLCRAAPRCNDRRLSQTAALGMGWPCSSVDLKQIVTLFT